MQVLPYKLKRLIPMLGLAGASLFMTGCSEKEESIPMRDVELKFTPEDVTAIAYSENSFFLSGNFSIGDVAKHYVNDKSVRTIYLVPEGNWYYFIYTNIQGIRKNVFEPLFEYSDKFKGKGDFNFSIGEASMIPEDSLWYLSKGWTINKYR